MAIDGPRAGAAARASGQTTARIRIARWPADGIAAAALIALAGAAGWLLRAYRLDDPFITYRYAANLAAGQGLVFNPGEAVLATTSPLFAVALGLIGRLGVDLPSAGFWAGVLALGVAAGLLIGAGRALGHPAAGWIAGLLTAASPDLMMTFGLETTLALALCLGAIWATVAGRLTLAGAILGLATLARGDAVVLGAVLLGYWLIVRRAVPFRACAGWAAVTAPWAGWATWFYGWPLPVTLAAKVLQGRSSFWEQHFLSGLGPAWQEWHVGISPLFWWIGPLVVIGLVRAALIDRAWLIWPAWTALYLIAYSVLDVPAYYWYYAPIVPAVAAIAGLGAVTLGGAAARLARRRAGLARGVIAVAAIAPVLIAQASLAAHVHGLLPLPFAVTYTEIGRQLAADLPPDATIGTLEVGLVGYYSGRTMIDFAGLLQPPIARHVAADDFGWAVEAYRPDYVLWSPRRDRWLTGSASFEAAYREVRRFPNPYLDPLILSRRKADSDVSH